MLMSNDMALNTGGAREADSNKTAMHTLPNGRIGTRFSCVRCMSFSLSARTCSTCTSTLWLMALSCLFIDRPPDDRVVLLCHLVSTAFRYGT